MGENRKTQVARSIKQEGQTGYANISISPSQGLHHLASALCVRDESDLLSDWTDSHTFHSGMVSLQSELECAFGSLMDSGSPFDTPDTHISPQHVHGHFEHACSGSTSVRKVAYIGGLKQNKIIKPIGWIRWAHTCARVFGLGGVFSGPFDPPFSVAKSKIFEKCLFLPKNSEKWTFLA